MLQTLQVHNIALMDALRIDFREGFSALTGETGAGKSILIEAVGFVLGERANKESIRTGEQKASVEGTFLVEKDSGAERYLKEQGLYEGSELTLYRELNLNGRNLCRINGTLVSAGELKKLGELLVDMHGQHAHQSLLDANTHMGLLDAYGGLLPQKARMLACREKALSARNQRQQLQKAMAERARRLNVIAFESKEIQQAQLRSGEEEELFLQKRKLQDFALVESKLQQAYEAIYGEGGALNSSSVAMEALQTLSEYDEQYEKAAQNTENAYYTLEDVSYTLRDALQTLSFDPQTLEDIESRLFLLDSLKRKYGRTVEEVIAYGEALLAEEQSLLMGESSMALLEQQEKEAIAAFTREAELLSKERKEKAAELKTVIEGHIRDMGMPHGSFTAGFTAVEPALLEENGIDAMEFLFSANRGEEEKPLVKVASGGEISRIMLAFKAALTEVDSIGTLIFDEIDTGISGLIAHAVAKKMQQLSKTHQVLCVTHLAQIAAYADRQYYIYKETVEDKTYSHARELQQQERAQELARIMGSVGDDSAIEHAKNLLEGAGF